MPQQPVNSQLGMPFIELQSVDSTNNYALARLHEGLAYHGTAYFAREQVKGKGQRGRSWSSQKGANIILSLVADPHPLTAGQQFQLSAAVALGVHDFFSRYAGDATKIKWPNDLYWQDRKAGGILIESIINAQEWKWAVIGVGININQTQFPADLHQPVSLKQITGRDFDPVDLARELCATLEKRFRQLVDQGFEEILSDYLSRLYKREEKVKLKHGNRVFEAILKAVTSGGRLVVSHTIEEDFAFGEVEFLNR